ncbi:MAG: hypothetical protein ACLQKH_09400 [Steroidobacteraceae bacterium]
MSDRIYIVPLPGVGTLELPEEIYRRCLRPIAVEVPSPTTAAELVDADGLAQALGVERSWVLRKARLREIPFVQVGKYVRFDVAAVVDKLR